MAVAVRGLDSEFGSKVRLQVIVRDRKSEAMMAEIKGFFGDESHGLVALDPDGSAKGKLPGHQFGKAEIMEKLQTLL